MKHIIGNPKNATEKLLNLADEYASKQNDKTKPCLDAFIEGFKQGVKMYMEACLDDKRYAGKRLDELIAMVKDNA